MSPWPKPRRGFTLVELLVVVLIIGILAAIALPRFLGQRTRAKNAAAQAAVRHALVAARSYYTQNSESYAGLGPAELKGYESSLSGNEPADTVKPGDAAANPQDIWIGNGSDGTNPVSGDANAGKTVVLCSVSKGDTTYCIKEVDGVASYLQTTNLDVGTTAAGSYSSSGWSSGAASGAVASQISSGWNHACAVVNGAAKCWGYNTDGELGDGTTTHRAIPTTVTGLSSGVSSIVAGYYHSCAILQTAAVKCWGKNDYGQLGGGSVSASSTSPVTVTGLSGVTQIATGLGHTCALLSDGSVRCWGAGGSGQLGNGLGTNSTSPVTPTGLTSGVTQINAGTNHTCAVVSGAAKCWGWNAEGQIGDGSAAQRNSPVTPTGLTSGVTQISGVYQHNCAVLSTGAVKCWGLNQYGAIGDGTVNNALTPQPVSGITSGATLVGVGYYHSCAKLASSVSCWGYNGSGGLADGTQATSYTPVPASLLGSGLASFGTQLGYIITCYRFSSGAVRCNGNNAYGQLGNGQLGTNSTTSLVTPTGLF